MGRCSVNFHVIIRECFEASTPSFMDFASYRRATDFSKALKKMADRRCTVMAGLDPAIQT